MKTDCSRRLNQLGTETAFAVSQDAADYALSGKTIYPFHLGDINIKTPENIIEATKRAMCDGKTGYVPSDGIPQLRDALADSVGDERGINFTRQNVVIQPGGKPVIAKFIHALMNPGDGVLYPNPGYPIYESQIEFNGGDALPYSFIPTSDGFMIDRDRVETLINNNTRLFIYNNYQNPMGCESDNGEMEWLADLALKYDLWVLSDEAYHRIKYSGRSYSIASFPGMYERTIILYTFSKTYAMTGWRLGAAIGPESIIKIFSKLSVNDESCTNHFIQYGGVEALTGNQDGVTHILNKLQKRRDILAKNLKEIKGIQLYIPNSTFYLFPDVTSIYNSMNAQSYEDFRLRVLRETGVSFCTREHFGTPFKDEKRKYIRFAYSGISINNIQNGLKKLKNFCAELETSTIF